MTDSNTTPTPGTKAPSPAAMAKKPGPRPRAAAKTVTPAPLPAREPSDPSKFGRVDEDGNVFLTRGGQERQIGSWQAGTPEEGLAHYGQRYDDLVTEVELIETRLRAHPEDADSLRKSAEALKASLTDAAVIGDIDAVEARLDKAIDASDTAREKAKEQKAQRREQAIARKEALAAEAEDLAENSTEWKAAGRAPREVDDKLWERFRAAQDHFFEARNAINAERDRKFEANAEAKDALIAEYDSLIDPAKGLGAAKAKLRELQDKWDEIGFVPRGRVREFEDKIGSIEKRVSEAEDSRWRKTDPAQQDKVNQFQVKADDFTKQAEAAEAKGDATKAASLREQAKQWQEFADVAAKAVNEG